MLAEHFVAFATLSATDQAFFDSSRFRWVAGAGYRVGYGSPAHAGLRVYASALQTADSVEAVCCLTVKTEHFPKNWPVLTHAIAHNGWM